MRRVHEKSIILGIGIGMIITSIAGLIYSGGENKGLEPEKLSREEIIRLAKDYGMIEKVGFIDDGSTSQSISSVTTSAVSTEKTADQTSNAADTTTAQSSAENGKREISIEIKQGFNLKKVNDVLFENGVISNKEEFKSVMDSYDASTKIKVGKYMFRENDDYDYIVKTICDIK